MRPLHGDLHVKRSCARRSKTIRNGCRSRLHEMHGLHQRLSKRRAVFWFWKAGRRRSEIDGEKLFSELARRNRRGGRVSGELSCGLGCLSTRADVDGTWMCGYHDVSRAANLKITPGQRFVSLPL